MGVQNKSGVGMNSLKAATDSRPERSDLSICNSERIPLKVPSDYEWQKFWNAQAFELFIFVEKDKIAFT